MASTPALPLNLSLFRSGMRVAVAVSGGADSVALMRALLDPREGHPGIVLSVVHVHHGLRGAEADGDADFVAALAARHGLPFHLRRFDTAAAALANQETIEEAARNLRYACFHSLLTAGETDAVATAHTLDDQAETVLHRFMRGAWTEGLGGIHPIVRVGSSAYIRPLLGVRRTEVEAYLTALGQTWRSDSSNADIAFTRNRIRRELMPLLRTYNPRIDALLGNVSAIARDEDAYWNEELARLLPSMLLPGKPVRGGGRANAADPAATVLAIEIERLRPLAPAVRRRVLRAAAARLHHSLGFDHTEALLLLCGFDPEATVRAATTIPSARNAPRRLDLSGELKVERTPRELRFTRSGIPLPLPAEYLLPIPGEARAQDFALMFRASASGSRPAATIRACRPSDRFTLRHSIGPKTAKEVLERLHLSASERARWPVVEWQGKVIWLRGVMLDSTAAVAEGVTITTTELSGQA